MSSSALAQRRGANHSHREAIVQVLAQLPFANRGFGIAVGRCDDAHVDRNLARRADRTNLRSWIARSSLPACRDSSR